MPNQTYLALYLTQLPAKASPTNRLTAQKFIGWLKDREPSTEMVKEFLEYLKKEGYAPGTRSLAFAIVRRVFKVNKLSWDFPRGSKPRVEEKDVEAPSLATEVIDDLIRGSAKLSPRHRAFLAVATTYGLRRIEIATLHAQSFNWEGKTLYVETAKHGRQRYHLIPEEIISIVRAYPWSPVSMAEASRVFKQLKEGASLKGPQWAEVGWHSVRRSVDKVLQPYLSEGEMYTFLRWKRSTASMPTRYSMTTVLGREGAVKSPGLRDEGLDRKAFEHNPWLKIWKELTP